MKGFEDWILTTFSRSKGIFPGMGCRSSFVSWPFDLIEQ